MSIVMKVEGGSRAVAPKGLLTYALTHMGKFLLLLPAIEIWVFRWKFRELGLKTEIWAWRLEFGPRG